MMERKTQIMLLAEELAHDNMIYWGITWNMVPGAPLTRIIIGTNEESTVADDEFKADYIDRAIEILDRILA